MKILLIGATGIIGRAIKDALPTDIELITATRTSGDVRLDMSDTNALRRAFADIGPLDGIICAAGDGAMVPLATMTDAEFNQPLDIQMKGQMNVLRLGIDAVNAGGSITLTSGVAAQSTMPATSTIAASCAAIEAFVRVAAAETDAIRINAVSPIFVKESMALFGMPTDGGLSAADTARAYLAVIHGDMHGQILNTPKFA